MAEDSAPPPPPPLSPPPALGATTIGKYIARFRYEKPQPREARVAARRGDFWWTKSLRYARSPPPSPSTWASGDVFSFPDEQGDEKEEEEEENEGGKINEKMTQEKEVQSPQEGENDEDRSVDSVESKLRRRLGVWGSDSSQGGEVLTIVKPPEVLLQSWGSAEWGSVDLEEVEEVEEVEREDPEEVIKRVRRRLGWGSTAASAAASTSALRPIDFRLSIDKREEPRQMGRKPPLSPGSCRRGGPLEGFGARSTPSWGSTERQREVSDEDEVKSSSSPVRSAGAREPGVEAEWQSPVARSEEKSVCCDSVRSREEDDDARSFQTGTSSLDFTDKALRSSGSSVGSRVSGGHEPQPDEKRCNDTILSAEDSDTGPVNDQTMPSRSDESNILDIVETKEEQQKSPPKGHQLAELPLLQTASPARPEPALDLKPPLSNASLSVRSHHSSASTRGQDKSIPTETAKTLDSLVSLVVHSWELDFFSDPSSEQQEIVATDEKHEEDSTRIQERSDIPLSAASSPTQPSENCLDDSSEVADSIARIQSPSAAASAEEIVQVPVASDTVKELPDSISQLDLDDEDVEESEVPGEEEDQIVQMLLERIALLEGALRQIDS